jgi:hypothetical protein
MVAGGVSTIRAFDGSRTAPASGQDGDHSLGCAVCARQCAMDSAVVPGKVCGLPGDETAP